MTRLQGLPPILDPNTRVPILGSMPGAASLQAQQYYAHPRNAFWPIVGSFCGFAPSLPYGERIAHLRQHGIGIWDALQGCERPSSFDRDIVPGSETATLPG
jgi:TDG/mug DNA glycosylase family protein